MRRQNETQTTNVVLLLIGVLLLVAGPVFAQELINGELSSEEAQSASEKIPDASSSPNAALRDPFPFTRSNHLRQDDPDYNQKYPLWIPATEVVATNGLLWAFDRYVADDSFSHISMRTVRNNFSNGWTWDTDDFPTNFSLHPYLGSAYFNCGRSNGYNFYESSAFSFGGSLMWELFMENTKPSYNDLINTTVSGIFLGEVEYRLSSKFLDDRKSGGQRILREVVATIIDPERGFNRLVQGKMFRVVQQEVYQKESLHLTVGIGARRTNRASGLGFESIKAGVLNFNIVYGDPYEVRSRKPFDYFKIRADLTSGDLTHIAHNVTGDGFLFGRNTNNGTLIGAFQHYDYWNTESFEDFIDQRQQMPSRSKNLGYAFILGGRRWRGIGLHQLREPEDGIERTAQLMAHAGKEFRFRKVGLFRQ